MTLKNLLENVETIEIDGDLEKEITSLFFDSRKVVFGSLFFAVTGEKLDGHNFIDTAITKGAVAIICERIPENTHAGVTYIKVKNVNDVIGPVASEFFGRPSEHLTVVGVTGTNGKTTIATMLYKMFNSLGEKAGLLSTIENRMGDIVVPAIFTTADAISVQENLQKMVEQDCKYAFMEVSSHSIVQERIKGIKFAGGIFTNLTQDHLDYHQTMEEYAKAKQKFFSDLLSEAFALYNADDAHGKFMVENSAAKVVSYGENVGDFGFVIKDSSPAGLTLSINDLDVKSPLVGKFNAYNLTAIFGAAKMLGKDEKKIHEVLEGMTGARGRMDKIAGRNGITGLIDYSHTPDALKNALETINDFKAGGKVITVFGAGGDRDKTKRPVMGEIASDLSDIVVVTSDNPRSEDPDEIIKDILVGMPDTQGSTLRISDRREAIEKAVSLAKPGDIILLAGKGHEDYQEIKGVKNHFSDREILEKLLK